MTDVARNFASPDVVTVTVTDAAQLDEALSQAVETVRKAAIYRDSGIMITRTGPGQYGVRADSRVPVGLTRQQYV